MTLTFLGNRYQRSETTVDTIPAPQSGMYRGTRYTIHDTILHPATTVHLSYRGVKYDR